MDSTPWLVGPVTSCSLTGHDLSTFFAFKYSGSDEWTNQLAVMEDLQLVVLSADSIVLRDGPSMTGQVNRFETLHY